MSELNLVGGTSIYSRAQIVRELEREIKMRRKVYGNLVETGAMEQREASYRIGILEQVMADYVGSGA